VTMETAIQNLADAINNLATAYGNVIVDGQPEAAPEEDPPKKGRAKKTDSPDAAAEEPNASADTKSDAHSSTAAAGAGAQGDATIDAGTGKPIKTQVLAPGERGPDYQLAKTKASELTLKPDGEVRLTELLRKHTGIADGPVKFGNLANEVLAAFTADVETALAGGSALED
jgi:hypothetical protein